MRIEFLVPGSMSLRFHWPMHGPHAFASTVAPASSSTGRHHGNRVAVVKGLEPGERIALAGTFLLDSETRMKSNDRPHH